jgi:hypothetical protein
LCAMNNCANEVNLNKTLGNWVNLLEDRATCTNGDAWIFPDSANDGVILWFESVCGAKLLSINVDDRACGIFDWEFDFY